MKILMAIAGFLTLIIVVAAIILIIIAIAKGKIKTPGTPSGKTLKTIITLIIVASIGYFGYRYFSERAGIRERQQTTTRELSLRESMPLCADGEYDFSNEKLPAEVEVNFSPDCVTAVRLPFRADFRIKPDARVKIRFINGTEVIDGPEPSHQNWVGKGQGRELFKVYGLKEAGTLKISLEKRT